MKKLLLSLFFVIIGGFLSHAQTFVSTDPANKNVVLEEYTGIGCGYCPDGHKIANQIAANNPGRVVVINIHQGNFAMGTPNYTTQWGNALAGQTGLTGYPAGTVNRHVFSGSTTALSRAAWPNAASQILGQSSYVNVAATSTIDWETRELTVDVEVYYTGTTAPASNYLHVALLQNNVLGPQSGMAGNPAQVENGQYRHMHMLRHLLTGQWGEAITTTSQGSFVSKQYTYTIPAHLNNISYVLQDLEVVVFISETEQEIITGAQSETKIINGVPVISKIEEIETFQCDNVKAKITIENFMLDTLTSFSFAYTYDGDVDTVTQTNLGIPFRGHTEIELPEFLQVSASSTKLTVQLIEANGDSIGSDSKDAGFLKKVVEGNGYMTLKIATDQWASETTFKIFKEDGTVLLQGGPWTDSNKVGITERYFAIEPPAIGCYVLEVYDTFGDGINSGYGAGYFQVIDGATGNIIIHNNGKFGSKATHYIYATAPSSIDDFSEEMYDFTIYPNPVSSILKIETSATIDRVEVLNLQGQRVILEGNTKEVNVSNLVNGVYILHVHTDQGIKIEKFIKQ